MAIKVRLTASGGEWILHFGDLGAGEMYIFTDKEWHRAKKRGEKREKEFWGKR